MFSKPESVCKLIGLFAEEMLILIQEKNADAKILAEFTIMVEPEGVRLILRDSGKVFDITEEDAKVDSFRQYVVANMRLSIDNKAYITTTGYNRNELFFPDPV